MHKFPVENLFLDSGCIFDDYFSQPDEILDLKKLVREFSYHGFKVRLAQIISEGISVSSYVSDLIKLFERTSTQIPSDCVCSDDSTLNDIVNCKGCVLGRVFTRSGQSAWLEKLVKHFSSVSIFKRYLEVMECTNGIEFTKFYVQAMYCEIIQVNGRIELLQNEYESKQSAIGSIEEKITSIKEKCIKYKNECKSMGYTISDPISSADNEIFDLIESGNEKYSYLATAPDSVAPGSGTYRVVRATGTSAGGISSSGVSAANGLSVGGPSVGLLSVAPAAAVCGQRSTRSRPRPRVPRTCGRVVDLDAGQEEVDAVLEDVSSASEEDLKDPDYNPGGDSN